MIHREAPFGFSSTMAFHAVLFQDRVDIMSKIGWLLSSCERAWPRQSTGRQMKRLTTEESIRS